MGGSRTWALVMNGVRARILRSLEEADGEAPVELASSASSTHLRDIMADKAGRSFSSDASGRRSAMEPGGDAVMRDMQDFAGETAEFLERHHRAGDFSRLAIFAEPKMLGIVRTEFPETLWSTVFMDVPMNLVSLPERELRERVRDHIQGNT